MMSQKFAFRFAPLAALALAGCVAGNTTAMKEGLPTGVALEEFAPSFRIGFSESSTTVAAAPSVVRERLRAFGETCLNGRTAVVQRTSGGLPMGGQMTQTYKTAITNEDGTQRFIIAQQLGGAVLTNDAGRAMNVQVSTKIQAGANGGTVLNTVSNRTFGALVQASNDWANGTSNTCPGIFG